MINKVNKNRYKQHLIILTVKMSRGSKSDIKPIEQYDHKGKERCYNPPVGLVTSETDTDSRKKKYSYDPHLDPYLQWAGKAEHTSFEIPTVSLHERIDPCTIIEAVRKREGVQKQMSLFEYTEAPLCEAIEFYRHRHNWSNRIIAGDYGIKYGSNFQPFVNKRDVN